MSCVLEEHERQLEMVGIKGVALRVNVSIATVSRVMNSKDPLIQVGRRNLIHIACNRHHEADSHAVAFEDLCSWAGAVHVTYTT